jgi:hypothetical protein
MTTYPENTDIVVRFEPASTVWTFEPVSDYAKSWVELNLHIASWQWVGNAFGVEHRQARSVLEHILYEGLSAYHPTFGFATEIEEAA